MSIPSSQGIAHGHLTLVVDAARHLAVTTYAFIVPAHPGPHIALAATASNAQITEANRVYQSSIKSVNIYKAVEASLKKQLIIAVPFTYIDELSDEEFGFANVTTLQILTHLDTTYGIVTPDDLETNLKHMTREWGTDQPIEDLWRQIRICRTFAASHDPITELTAIRAAVTNLEKSNLFIDDVKQWRKRPDAEKTMANLKLDFNAADKERRRQLTSVDGGFAGAALKQQDDKENQAPKEKPKATFGYCWSHGLGWNPSHTSAKCRGKAPGHRDNATMENMLGGCNTIIRQRGEDAIYQKPYRERDNNRNRTDKKE
jgi:hypothetical protein